jgi:glycosyltransferase involved in cell wall biosynthesis
LGKAGDGKNGLSAEKITVITNGLEDEAFSDVEKLASVKIRDKVTGWGKYLIQIGRVYPIKNYETTIKALNYLPADVNFVIVGPVEKNNHPDYWNKLQKLIADSGLSERVVFAGVIKGIDKYYAIKHSQMMVHMALWESFCNVVHEAMSQGKPVIVAKNTALTFLVKEGVNGYLVETRDYIKLAEKIKFILNNKNSSQQIKMAKYNRKKGLEETWTKVAGKMDLMYSKALIN